MQSKGQYLTAFVLAGLMVMATASRANNVSVTNITLTGTDTGYTHVQCDVSWNNAWKASWTPQDSTTVTNWDAAWVFVKYRVTPNGAWQHASLSTNRADHVVPAGAALDVGLTGNKGVGVFLYRSAEGNGTWTNTVKLRWVYAQDGISRTTPVDVCVHAIEMVYVPKGSFYAGDGAADAGICNFENGKGTNALQITSEGALTLGGGAVGSLGNNNASGAIGPADDFNDVTSQALPAAFPKGYNAFYCMKYEVSQGQYAAFLNQLTPAQAGNRYPNDLNQARFTISSNANVYAANAPERACNWLSWPDNAAYSDWAGLRPMTELEFEKACRGAAAPLAREYACGLADTPTAITNFFSTDGSGVETALPATANINVLGLTPGGPVRCGIFATASSGRAASGATYWGIMEMSGNLWEIAITVGHATGRAFTGVTGDGTLDAAGNADVSLWPSSSASQAYGCGIRGGQFGTSLDHSRTSGRRLAAYSLEIMGRISSVGCRAVRTAP